MAKEAAKSIHAGHRARIRERMRTTGLEAFSEHEVLELLLTYAIPQRDVNPLAHELIDTFGSLSAVLHAQESELMRVSGMGSHAASLLHMVPQLMRYVQMSEQKESPVILNALDARRYCAPLFLSIQQERIYMVCMDQAGRVIHRLLLHEGTVDRVALHPRQVVEAAVRHQAHSVLLAHNHPAGVAEASQADIDTTKLIGSVLHAIGVSLVDHLIYAGPQVYSMARAHRLTMEDDAQGCSYVREAANSVALREKPYEWIGIMGLESE